MKKHEKVPIIIHNQEDSEHRLITGNLWEVDL
jgi:hypothetical protein